jgi:hypothetical protein
MRKTVKIKAICPMRKPIIHLNCPLPKGRPGASGRPVGVSLKREVSDHKGFFDEMITSALNNNKCCNTGLLATKNVFYFDKGPTGDKELLAFIYADDRRHGYWYGHVCRLNTKKLYFCAVITWLKIFVNAHTPKLLLERYHYATAKLLEYEPCTVQHEDDVIKVVGTFDEAVISLAKMIKRFDIDKRFPQEGSNYYSDNVDVNIMFLYGLDDLPVRKLIHSKIELEEAP